MSQDMYYRQHDLLFVSLFDDTRFCLLNNDFDKNPTYKMYSKSALENMQKNLILMLTEFCHLSWTLLLC